MSQRRLAKGRFLIVLAGALAIAALGCDNTRDEATEGDIAEDVRDDRDPRDGDEVLDGEDPGVEVDRAGRTTDLRGDRTDATGYRNRPDTLMGGTGAQSYAELEYGEPGTRVGAGYGDGAATMEDMSDLHHRFQQMSGQDHWTQQGLPLPEVQSMMNVSAQMAMMSEAVRRAMDDMQDLERQPGDPAAYQAGHVDRLHEHLKKVADELEAMRNIMAQMAPGALEDRDLGAVRDRNVGGRR